MLSLERRMVRCTLERRSAMGALHSTKTRGGEARSRPKGTVRCTARYKEYLHPLVLGAAPAFARCPPRAQHIGGLAVDAVRRVDTQHAVYHLVHAGRAHPGVHRGNLGWDVASDQQVRGDGVASRVARLEYAVHFADGEGVGDWGLG